MQGSRFFLSLVGSLSVTIGVGALAWKARADGPAAPAPAPARLGKGTPVVVELFSSEGCSSCPPADAFLQELDRTQPYAPGVAVVALEFHVDYWDYLGWKDPYSRHEFTNRQETYARALGDRGIYTPEIIVQGRALLGSRDARSAQKQLEAEALRSRVRVRVSVDGASVRVHVEGALPSASPVEIRDVWLAITESGLRTEVQAGENRGRDLDHAPVVRRLLEVGKLGDGAFDGQVRVELVSTWKAKNLRFVAFVQERQSRRILGATSSR